MTAKHAQTKPSVSPSSGLDIREMTAAQLDDRDFISFVDSKAVDGEDKYGVSLD